MNRLRATNLAQIPLTSHYFMGRNGGTSPKPWDSLNVSYDLGDVSTRVDENRARICALVGVSPAHLFTPKQIHAAHGIRVSRLDCYRTITSVEADAVWTTDDNTAVAVQTADCAPVLFASEDGRVVGAVHAGWRGAVAGIVVQTLQAVGRELALSPQQFVVAIGPCIGFDAFEVGPEVIESVQKVMPIDGIVKEGEGDRSFLDLAGLIEKQLQQVGVSRVELLRRCTVMHSDEYFSHRRSKGRRGGQLSIIAKSPNDIQDRIK